MAEVAGPVIGGIGLTAIVDKCITIIKYIDAGKQYWNDRQDAALMLTLIGGRLNRWERTIRDNPDLGATEGDRESAEIWLKQIHDRLEEAEKLGQRYIVEPIKKSADVSHLVERVQTKVLCRNGGLSMSRKARWVLIDQEKMQTLIEKLDMLVGSLERLFPSLQGPRMEMLRSDVAGLLGPTMAQESPEAVKALKAAAAKVDKDFEAMISSPSSHIYRNILNTDETRVCLGDYVSTDFAYMNGVNLRSGSNTYDAVRSSGKSAVNMGNMYGGKSVFEL